MSRAIDFLKKHESISPSHFEAVSYTHLDVYKRQIFRKMRNGERKTRLGWNGHVTSPCL